MVRVFFVSGPPAGPTWVILIILYGSYRTNGRNSVLCCLLRWQFAVPFLSGFSSFVFSIFHMTYLWLRTEVWLRFLRAQSSYAHVHMVGLSFRFPLLSFFLFCFCFFLTLLLCPEEPVACGDFYIPFNIYEIKLLQQKRRLTEIKKEYGNKKFPRPTQM